MRGALSLADVLALAAVTDLVTAGHALGLGRTKALSWLGPGGSPARSSAPAAPGWSSSPGS